MMYQENLANSKLSSTAEAHLIHETCKALEYTFRHNAERAVCKDIEEMRRILKNYKILDARKNLIRKQFWGYLLMRLSPRVYLLVHKVMRIG
jgi:hypothetical protein